MHESYHDGFKNESTGRLCAVKVEGPAAVKVEGKSVSDCTDSNSDRHRDLEFSDDDVESITSDHGNGTI